jgi:hypothetical protein
MGLRRPSDLLRPVDRRSPSPAGLTSQSTPIDTRFIQTISQNIQNKEKQRKSFLKALFENDADLMRVRSESELSRHEGLNALESAPTIKQQYMQDLNNRFNEIPEGFREDPELRLSLIRKTGQFDRFAIPYTNTEVKQVESAAFDSRVVNDINDVVENANDLDYMETQGIPRVEQSLFEQLSRKYGSDPNQQIGNTTVGELMMEEMQVGVSGSVTQAIQQQVLVNDFDTARQTVERFYDRITDEDRIKIKSMIEKGLKSNENDRALDLTNKALTVLGDDASLVQMEEYVRAASGSNSDLYKKSLSMLQGRYKIREDQRKRNYELAEADIYDNIVNGKPYDQESFNNLPPERQDKIIGLVNKNNGGRAVVTDYAKFQEITNSIDLMPPEEFITQDIDKQYGMYLSAQDRNTLKTRQNQMRNELNREFRDGQRWTPSVYKDVAKTYIKAKDLFADEEGKVYAAAENEYARLIEENPRITKTELTKRIKKALWERGTQTTVTEPASFFGLFDIPFTGGDEVTTLSETISPERQQAIDPSWVRQVQQNRIQRGLKPMKESEIQNFFLFLQNKRPDINLSLPPK